jgi:hypothetical protein
MSGENPTSCSPLASIKKIADGIKSVAKRGPWWPFGIYRPKQWTESDKQAPAIASLQALCRCRGGGI